MHETAAHSPAAARSRVPEEPAIDVPIGIGFDGSNVHYSLYQESFDHPQMKRALAFALDDGRPVRFLAHVEDGTPGARFAADREGRPVAVWIDPQTGEKQPPRTDRLRLLDGGRAVELLWHEPDPDAQKLWIVSLALVDEGGGSGSMTLAMRRKVPIEGGYRSPQRDEPIPIADEIPLHVRLEKGRLRCVNVFRYDRLPAGLDLEPVLIGSRSLGVRFRMHLDDPALRFVSDRGRLSVRFRDPRTGGPAPEPAGIRRCRALDPHDGEIDWQMPSRRDGWSLSAFGVEVEERRGEAVSRRLSIDPTVVHDLPPPGGPGELRSAANARRQ